MAANPAVGVVYHWLGGLASGSFYVPYRGVKRWAWETYWLAGGFFSWIIAPWILALIMTRDLFAVLGEVSAATLFWSFFFGLLWGVGGLTFGLTMRYLGLSLGMAVVLGLCAAFGTLMPPIFRGVFMTQVVGTTSGRVILLGILVCLAGISLAGLAGIAKERVMSPEQQKAAIEEFNLKKGMGVAILSGVMSACFAYGLAAGDPIKVLTLKHGTPALWQGLPVLVVVLIGGFATNFIWCLILLVQNRTGHQFFNSYSRKPCPDHEMIIETAIDAPSREVVEHSASQQVQVLEAPPVRAEMQERAPMLRNYLLCALAGTTWYFQFFFYTMGETQMGRYKFSSWTLHMASIIIFSSLWGIAFKEWKGAGTRTGQLLTLALLLLVGSTVIVGYGNYLGLSAKASFSGPSQENVSGLWNHPPVTFDQIEKAVPSGVRKSIAALATGQGNFFDSQSFDPCVLADPTDTSKLIMFFSAMAAPVSSGVITIGRATSTIADPTTWTVSNGGKPVLNVGGNGAWDHTYIRQDSCFYDSGTIYMFYTGGGEMDQIGLATSTDNGLTRTKYSRNPVLTPTGQGRNDGNNVSQGAVLKEGSSWTMIYAYRNDSSILPGYREATSSDGKTWRKGGAGDILTVRLVATASSINL